MVVAADPLVQEVEPRQQDIVDTKVGAEGGLANQQEALAQQDYSCTNRPDPCKIYLPIGAADSKLINPKHANKQQNVEEKVNKKIKMSRLKFPLLSFLFCGDSLLD